MMAQRRRGHVPMYWWDFDRPAGDEIIIETDDPRVPGGIVERFTFEGQRSIDRAELRIIQLKSGASIRP